MWNVTTTFFSVKYLISLFSDLNRNSGRFYFCVILLTVYYFCITYKSCVLFPFFSILLFLLMVAFGCVVIETSCKCFVASVMPPDRCILLADHVWSKMYLLDEQIPCLSVKYITERLHYYCNDTGYFMTYCSVLTQWGIQWEILLM